MKHRLLYLVTALFFLSIFSGTSFAGIDFNIIPNTNVLGSYLEFQDIDQVESDFEHNPNSFITENRRIIPTGLAIVNTLGYPNGKSRIKTFPHFEVGVSAGLGVYQYTRAEDFDASGDNAKLKVPGGGINGAIHFGTGITDKIDVTAKLFVLGFFYSVDESVSETTDDRKYEFSIDETNIMSMGVKARYMLMERKRIIPLLFSFGGISLNLGVDYMHAKFSSKGSYFTRESVDFQYNDLSGTTDTLTADVIAQVDGNAAISWNIVSVTPEAFVYVDFLYLFSLYTGPSVSFNMGSVNFDVNYQGVMKADSDIIATTGTLAGQTLIRDNDTIGTASLTSDTSLYPYFVTPKWTLGLEINILMVKLNMEVASILTSPTESFTAQLGVRVQI